jgi:hypothetical protein
MLLIFLPNLNMGATGVGEVVAPPFEPLDAYPDPFGATSTGRVDPFAATSRLRGS